MARIIIYDTMISYKNFKVLNKISQKRQKDSEKIPKCLYETSTFILRIAKKIHIFILSIINQIIYKTKSIFKFIVIAYHKGYTTKEPNELQQ